LIDEEKYVGLKNHATTTIDTPPLLVLPLSASAMNSVQFGNPILITMDAGD